MPTEREIDKYGRRFVVWAHDFRRASPLYTALSNACATDRELLELFCESPPDQQRPTLPLAATHHLILRGTGHPLTDYYPSAGGSRAPDDALFGSFKDFCFGNRDELVHLLRTRNTQTNEARRAAQLAPALAVAAGGRPVALVEVGPSAGLNLVLDRYAFDWGRGHRGGTAGAAVTVDCEARGSLLPPGGPPPIRWRLGIDEQPVDVRDDAAVDWLAACIWPEQQERRTLFRAAVAAARDDPPPLVQADAVEALADASGDAPAGALLCVMHSHVAVYLSKEDRARLGDAVRDLSRGREVAWVTSEPPGTVGPLAGLPAALEERNRAVLAGLRGEGPHAEGFTVIGIVRFADGGVREARHLGIGGHHGHWLEWTDPATAA